MTTITTNRCGITNVDVADYTIQAFDALSNAVKGWQTFLALYGKPFDIRSFTPDDYVFTERHPSKYYYDQYWVLDLGEGWNIHVYGMEHTPTPTPTPAINIDFFIDNNQCRGWSFAFDNNGKLINSADYFSETMEHAWENIFFHLKRRAAVTIREYKQYLEKSAFYKTAEAEFGIKTRKKK